MRDNINGEKQEYSLFIIIDNYPKQSIGYQFFNDYNIYQVKQWEGVLTDAC